MAPTLRLCGLYGITPDTADTEWLLVAASQAAAGGMRWLQYRNKTLAPAQRQYQARRLREQADSRGYGLIINDDLQLALDVDAHGLHLGLTDGDPIQQRIALGAHRVLGLSGYNDLSRLPLALAASVDYLAFGAFFPSRTKPEAVPAAPALLSTARQLAPNALKLVAIGGITATNGAPLVTAGADLLAVCDSLFAAPDITLAAQALSACFGSLPCQPDSSTSSVLPEPHRT